MKQNYACIYGCGSMGGVTLEVLTALEVPIELVADRCPGKMLGPYVASSLEEMELLSKDIVCIIAIWNGAEKEKERLKKHFYTVVEMEKILKLKYYMDYYIPKDIQFGRLVFPFNHYESPYISKIEWDYFNQSGSEELYGIELNKEKQLKYLEKLASLFDEFYGLCANNKFRYMKDNDMFAESDAAVLYAIMRDKKTKRIIEIGSGFSTGIMLDVNKHFFDNGIDISCIEPYPERLERNLLEGDKVRINKKFLQEMNLKMFDSLEGGDILFIDSSHVIKCGGDVLIECFEILPRLKKGVLVHIHDILYPFSYPASWALDGHCYNEAFLIRALLTNNNQYEIILFLDMFKKLYRDKYYEVFNEERGGSLWLCKNWE